MTFVPDTHSDLIESPLTASFSTVLADGTPQVTAVWYRADTESVMLSMPTIRQKYKNLLARPKATLFIIDPANPFHTLEIRGTTRIDNDEKRGLEFYHSLVRHYGHDPESLPAPSEARVIVTLEPTRVVAQG